MALPAMCPADLDYAVRAILPLPRDLWDEAAEHLVRSTLLAEKVRAARGRAHPALGQGTLSATVSRWPLQTPPGACPVAQAEALAALSRAVIRACNRGSEAGWVSGAGPQERRGRDSSDKTG